MSKDLPFECFISVPIELETILFLDLFVQLRSKQFLSVLLIPYKFLDEIPVDVKLSLTLHLPICIFNIIGLIE